MSHHPFFQVSNFNDLVSYAFNGALNAVCWSRTLEGDFAEIIHQFPSNEPLLELDPEHLIALSLSEKGELARNILLSDYHLLKVYGAAPAINIIRNYDRDTTPSVFPRDVYSFHVDRSPFTNDTFLCTYFGEPSDLLLHEEAVQKIQVPEIREQLQEIYTGESAGFEAFLEEQFYDLHYQELAGAKPIRLGIGNLWRLATDHPESKAYPCVHRAPKEKDGEPRLLLIC